MKYQTNEQAVYHLYRHFSKSEYQSKSSWCLPNKFVVDTTLSSVNQFVEDKKIEKLPFVKRVILYGSRGRGDNKGTMDF
jgi:hypothetical protein